MAQFRDKEKRMGKERSSSYAQIPKKALARDTDGIDKYILQGGGSRSFIKILKTTQERGGASGEKNPKNPSLYPKGRLRGLSGADQLLSDFKQTGTTIESHGGRS